MTSDDGLAGPQIAKPSEGNKQYVDAMLEEYKSLRTESLNGINNRITILLSSFTSLSVITSATVVARLPSLIIGVVLGIAVPTLAKTLAMVWLAEYRRSQRAGSAIVALEQKINDGIGRAALTWETNLRTRRMKISTPYVYSVTILLTIGYISEGLALYYTYKGAPLLERWVDPKVFTPLTVTGGATLGLVLLEGASFALIRKEWNHALLASR